MHGPRQSSTIEATREGWELDPTTEFFQELEARGHEAVLENVTGTLRFDLVNGKRTARWLVAIRKGEIDVSHKNAKADCVVRADKTLFDGIASGEVNAFAAALRGLIDIEGSPELLVLFQRLFPGPPRSRS
jgi:putative sterol carrier protein